MSVVANAIADCKSMLVEMPMNNKLMTRLLDAVQQIMASSGLDITTMSKLQQFEGYLSAINYPNTIISQLLHELKKLDTSETIPVIDTQNISLSLSIEYTEKEQSFFFVSLAGQIKTVKTRQDSTDSSLREAIAFQLNLEDTSLVYCRKCLDSKLYNFNEFPFSTINKRELVDISVSNRPFNQSDQIKTFIDGAMLNISREIKDLKKMLLGSDESPHGSRPSLSPHRKLSGESKGFRVPSNSQLYSLLKTPTSKASKNSLALKHLNSIRELKTELNQCKQAYKKIILDINTTISDLIIQTSAVRENSLKNPNSGRNLLQSAKSKMEKMTLDVSNRVSTLNDVVEELKSDITVRRCKPTDAKLDLVDSELSTIKDEIQELVEFLEQVRPTWKSVWECELQTIVKEQAFLKEKDSQIQDLQEEFNDSQNIFVTLQKLISLQSQTSASKVVIEVLPAEEALADGINGILTEIKMAVTENDSDRRLKALERSERLRKFDKQQVVNEFEVELINFVKENKLRPIGGFEEIEKRVGEEFEKSLRRAKGE